MRTSTPFSVSMGNRIRLRREFLGMTQDDLAARMDYKGKASISRIESGENEVKTSKLPVLAEVLETDVAYLMGWSDPVPPVSDDEQELLGYYRAMNDHGKVSALMSVKGLSEQDLFKKEPTFASDG